MKGLNVNEMSKTISKSSRSQSLHTTETHRNSKSRLENSEDRQQFNDSIQVRDYKSHRNQRNHRG